MARRPTRPPATLGRAAGRLGRAVRSRPARLAAFAAAAAAAALGILPVASPAGYTIGPGDVRVEAGPARTGRTVIAIPPFGTVEAHTHAAPLRLTLSPATVDVPDLERLLARQPSTRTFVAGLQRERDRALLQFGLRLLAVGGGAGILAFLVLRGRRLSEAAASVVAGALVPVVLYGWALAGFDPTAFRAPRLTGALIRAPALVGPVEQLADRFEAFRKQLDVVGAASFSIYRFLGEQSVVPPDAIRILHLSDLHLNPVGYDVALQVARQFQVAAVVDTGDVTAQGTDVEASFVGRIGEFGVPYLFVRGNHDSAVTQGTVRIQPGAIVLDGDTAEVEGLTFFGVGDPIFTPGGDFTVGQQREAKERFAPEVLAMVSELPSPPDVVLIHDRLIARDLPGRVPLVLSGHGHRWFAAENEGTLILGVGSTGAAGLQSFTPESGEPIALQVLYFERGSRRLVAYDRIEVTGPRQQFFLERTIVEPANLPASPSPEPAVSPTPAGSPAG